MTPNDLLRWLKKEGDAPLWVHLGVMLLCAVALWIVLAVTE